MEQFDADMYDMTRVNANGYFDSENTEAARYEKKKAMNVQRTQDYNLQIVSEHREPGKRLC